MATSESATTTEPAPAPVALPSPFTNTTPPPILLTQGAEALIYRTHHLTSPPHADSVPACLKFRPSKTYRHPTIDARLTKQRVLAEARVLVKLSGLAQEGVHVPAVLGLEWDVARRTRGGRREGARAGAWLLMEWIEGRSVKEVLRECDAWAKSLPDAQGEEREKQNQAKEEVVEGAKQLLRRLGRAVAVMHERGGVVHGDLTSSNVMVRPVGEERGSRGLPDTSGEIVLIDFGLATQSIQDEDRAVDLYVLERAFGSTHPNQEAWFDAEVLQHQDGYRGSFKGARVVLKKLEEVRSRGRKRTMVG